MPRYNFNQKSKKPVVENCKTLEKKFEQHTNKWKHVPCSWME